MRLLCIDADSSSLHETASVLERETTATSVVATSSGSEALSALVTERFDCVVTEYDLPEMTGVELLEIARERTDELPVVLFAGTDRESVVREAFSMGATDYLSKDAPAAVERLTTRVEAVLERRRTERELAERIKELSTVELVTDLLADPDRPFLELLESLAEALPYAVQFPDIAEARVVAGEFEAVTDGFVPTERRLVARTTTVAGRTVSVEVVYLEACPDEDIGPFLSEEQRLLQSIVGLLRGHLEYRGTKERLELALTGANAGVWDLDVETMNVVWNENLERLFGLEPGAFEGTYDAVFEMIHPDDRAAVDNEAERAVEQVDTLEDEYRIVRADGEIRWVAARGQVFLGSDGAPARVVGILIDITDRKEREQHLVVVEHLLRHNVRNEMTIVRGFAETIRDETDDADIASHAAQIRRASDELLSLAENERELIHVLTGAPEIERIDLVETVEHVVDEFTTRYPGARIDSSLPPTATVFAMRQLPRAIEELLENAIVHNDSTEPTVSIRVETGARDETTRVIVVDDGPKIPEMELDIVVGERTADPLYHSTGLGLWLVYWIVRRSGGDVSFEANEPSGNVVVIDLPSA